MKYRIDYQETHDIDWFFRYKGKLYHAASNGGIIPDVIDSSRNRTIQEMLEEIEYRFDVELSENVWNYHSQEEDLDSFRDYASKGFISLDRTINENFEDSGRLQYHIVAYPRYGGMIENRDLLQLLPDLSDYKIDIK